MVVHGLLVADNTRMRAYEDALRRAVTPGCTVLDIGTGTGVFAMLACRLGARRVYAIEPAESIELAREVALANGYADRIVFIRDLSTRVTLPERVDVVVADLHGVLPFHDLAIPSLVDARERHLAPGGVMIPHRETLWAAVFDDAQLYARTVGPWASRPFGLDMDAVHRRMVHDWRSGMPAHDRLVTAPSHWDTLDYMADARPNSSAHIEWVACRAGDAHGLAVWFDSELASDVTMSNAPGRPRLIYENAIMPFASPVAVEEGDRIEVDLRATLVGDRYVWAWGARVASARTGRLTAEFLQSTAFSDLPKAAVSWLGETDIPVLDERGHAAAFVLRSMDGRASAGEIASRLQSSFPERFRRWEDALGYVERLAREYRADS